MENPKIEIKTESLVFLLKSTFYNKRSRANNIRAIKFLRSEFNWDLAQCREFMKDAGLWCDI